MGCNLLGSLEVKASLRRWQQEKAKKRGATAGGLGESLWPLLAKALDALVFDGCLIGQNFYGSGWNILWIDQEKPAVEVAESHVVCARGSEDFSIGVTKFHRARS